MDDWTRIDYLRDMSTGQGSTGNVIAAVCSFFIPGLGQLVQGRMLAALIQFLLTGLIWFLSFGTLGWIGHIISCIDAARWKAP
jgi:TM2 domain-containing membrane protein YozV